MEKTGYRETFESISLVFPGKAALDVGETAQVLGVSKKTVYAAIDGTKNPMPFVKVGNKLIIPVGLLARWMCTEAAK